MAEKLYVLAVDDETHILEVYKSILAPSDKPVSRRLRSRSKNTKEKTTYDFHTFSSGEAAVESVKEYYGRGKRFSVGFFDMRMPGGIDGLETIRQILEIDPDLNCCVVTADTDRPTKEILNLFRDPSQLVYLNKPFNTPEIAQLALALSNLWKTKRHSETMLDSLVYAAVQAIESRDPTTSGHSERVATLSVELAKAVDHLSDGTFEEVNFERHDIESIRYASLLHDFGKIGVRENVLVKAKKLYPQDLEKIALKLEIESLRGNINSETKDLWWKDIIEANQPSILPAAIQLDLDNIFQKGLLTEEEFQFLCIPKGTLTDEERHEIESHVTVTYQFLSAIEWTEEFQRVPEIAWSHHEKMDGSGYPRGIRRIPVESRMMTISDIFDALTASDRPYKSAVPLNRALDIIQYEVNNGKCDGDLFQVFLDAKVYEHVVRP